MKKSTGLNPKQSTNTDNAIRQQEGKRYRITSWNGGGERSYFSQRKGNRVTPSLAPFQQGLWEYRKIRSGEKKKNSLVRRKSRKGPDTATGEKGQPIGKGGNPHAQNKIKGKPLAAKARVAEKPRSSEMTRGNFGITERTKTKIWSSHQK